MSEEQEYETYAYFWVSDYNGKPEELSERLGLNPNRVIRKGELISSNSKIKHEHSFWEFYSSLPRTEIFQDSHIENIVSSLMSKKEVVLELGKEYEVGINCVGYYTNTNAGFHLSKDLLEKCAMLGLSIDFDLYNL